MKKFVKENDTMKLMLGKNAHDNVSFWINSMVHELKVDVHEAVVANETPTSVEFELFGDDIITVVAGRCKTVLHYKNEVFHVKENKGFTFDAWAGVQMVEDPWSK